jgi:RNA polymerase sigma-70 factor (ECF subfamily)
MTGQSAASRFDEMYDSTNKAVLTFIIAKCGRVADVHDIFQETYFELHQLLRKRGVDYVTNEKALVLRIASRKVAKYHKLAERSKIFVPMTQTDENGDDAPAPEMEADAFLVEDFTVNRMLLESAKEFVMQKPEIVKKAFYLYYDVGLTLPEIAQELSISESSVKNKIYRTVKELRNLIDGGQAQ